VSHTSGDQMSTDSVRVEDAAKSENDWVRARILKQDPPAEGSLLKIAERARDMAANSLGKEHPAYAVALQNLGLYYDAIENDTAKANELFAQARAVLKDDDLPLAYGFHWLGIFHNQVSHDANRAEAPLAEALAIQRRAPGCDDVQLAETMIALADAKSVKTGIHSAIALLEEALAILRARAPEANSILPNAEKRLGVLTTLRRMQIEDDS
jgi:tetratricopeptide (TPR) repeat protein